MPTLYDFETAELARDERTDEAAHEQLALPTVHGMLTPMWRDLRRLEPVGTRSRTRSADGVSRPSNARSVAPTSAIAERLACVGEQAAQHPGARFATWLVDRDDQLGAWGARS